MDKYEVVVTETGIELPHEAIELFRRVKAIDETIKTLKAEKDAIEKPLKAAMQNSGIKKFEYEGLMTATTVAGGWSEQVDTERMKKDGIYDKYMYRVPRNGSVRITYKKEKANGKEE